MPTSTRLIVTSLLSLGLVQTVWAEEVDSIVQGNICANTMVNNSIKVLHHTKTNGVVLKRDFNNIHCKSSMGFEGGNLYQVAVHYQRFGMLDSFLDEHGLDINLIDTDGRTILDWVDYKISEFKRGHTPRQVKRYKKLRAILVEDYQAKTRAQLDAAP